MKQRFQNIFQLNKSEKNLTLLQERLEGGLKKVKSSALDPMVQEDYIILVKSKEFSEHLIYQRVKRNYKYVMLELVHNIKKKILIDKSKCFRNNFPIEKFIQILDLDSIGKDQDLCRFWTKSSKVISEKLLLPTETDCVDLELNYLNGYSSRMMSDSWFSIKSQIHRSKIHPSNYQKTFLQSQPFLLQKIMECDQQDIEKNEKQKKIKNQKFNNKLEDKEDDDDNDDDNDDDHDEDDVEEEDDDHDEDDVDVEEEDNASNKILRAIKIRIYPTATQKTILKNWFGVTRWTYNQGVKLIEQINHDYNYTNQTIEFLSLQLMAHNYVADNTSYKIKEITNEINILQENKKLNKIKINVLKKQLTKFKKQLKVQEKKTKKSFKHKEKYLSKIKTNIKIKDLRKIINENTTSEKNRWHLSFPYDLKDESLRDLLKNYNNNLSRNIDFHLKIKKKKDRIQSFNILTKHWNNKNNMFAKICTVNNMKSAEPLPEKLGGASRLLKEDDKYYISIPMRREKRNMNNENNRIISIDPGLNKFATGYEPNGTIIEIAGNNCKARISKLLYRKNQLISRIAKVKKKKKNRMKKALRRARERIRNLISDLHKKTIKFLCDNYNHIIIPKLNFHKMKKLRRRTKEQLKTYRHCEFVDKLKTKAKTYSKVLVSECNEAYTSKTCCNCGNIDYKLGSKQKYKCQKCNIEVARDVNGAINIMIRYLTKRVRLTYTSCNLAALGPIPLIF